MGLNCLLQARVVHFELFCLQFDIAETLTSGLLIELAFKVGIHQLNEVSFINLFRAGLRQEVISYHSHIVLSNFDACLRESFAELLDGEPSVAVLVIEVE